MKFFIVFLIAINSQIALGIEIRNSGEMVASNLLFHQHTVYLQLGERKTIHSDQYLTEFQYEAKSIESYRGNFPENFCFVITTESPKTAPIKGVEMIISFNDRDSDKKCFGVDANNTSPAKKSYLKILRAIRDAN